MDQFRSSRIRRLPGGQTLRSFYTRGFWRIWAGSMFWYTARWMDMFVLQWQVLVMTDSAFEVALVGFYRMVPLFFFGLASGLIADRFDRRKVVLFVQLWNAAVVAALAALAFTDKLAPWHLAILVTALGFSYALDMPSRRAFIYDMMGPRRLVNALALDHLGMDGAKMLGPILGGLLWPVIGAGGCFLCLAIGYLVNFFVFLGLPPSKPPAPSSPGPVWRTMAEGLRYVFQHPVILGVLAITVVLNLLGFTYQNLVPVVAKKMLEQGPRLTGLLLAADGFGAMIVALLIASRRDLKHKGRAFVLGSAFFMAAAFLFSLSPWYVLSFAVLLIAGAGGAGFATMQSGVILLSASDAMRGRAMGTLILAIGFQPLGTLLIGVLASALGAPLAITVTVGAGLLLLAPILWWATALWQFRGAG
jgi:MFS family permease